MFNSQMITRSQPLSIYYYTYKSFQYSCYLSNVTFRYRAIIYPLKRKPGKQMSLFVIAIIWIASLVFAVPMGMVYHFEYHEEYWYNGSDWIASSKPFCHITFEVDSPLVTKYAFRYYR